MHAARRQAAWRALSLCARLSARLSACLCACLGVAGMASAQAVPDDDGPLLRFGLTTGVTASSNRGLDTDSLGSTTELTSQLDFLMRFATPIQALELSGDLGLRSVSGAEAGSLPSGLYEPALTLGYDRQSRDARLDVDLFLRERDVSSSELQFDPDAADFDLLEDTGTQRRFGADVALELRRRAPFGITLSAGYTGLRYSDTDDPDLTDQDRFRVGARFRFDLNPATQATLNARFSTFEDFGDTEGRRDTFSLDGSLRRSMTNGSATLRANATDTEDGTRYTLSAGRTLETELWEVTGVLGLTRGVDGNVDPTGELGLTRALPNGELTASLARTVRSNTDDEEQEVTTLRLGYATQLTPLTAFNASYAFTDRDAADDGDDGSFSVLSVGVQHSLTRDWSLNVGLQHRINDDATSGKASDSQLSITVRRSLLVRR